MMHEKRGVIEPGRTPPEDDDVKSASANELDQHPTTRAADAVSDNIRGNVESTDATN